MKWKELLGKDAKHAAPVDVIPWLSRAMMDSIGEGTIEGFGHSAAHLIFLVSRI